MYEPLVQILQILSYLLSGYLLQYFIASFLESRTRRHRWNQILPAVLFCALKYIAELFLTTENYTIRAFAKLLITTAIVLAITLCFYKPQRQLMTFLIITYLAVNELCFFMAYMLMPLGQFLIEGLTEMYGHGKLSAEIFLKLVKATMLILIGLVYTVYILLTWLSLRKIVKAFRQKDYAIQKRELLFLLAPNLAGLLICVLLRMLMVTVEDNVPKLLYDKYPPLLCLIPAISLLSLLSILYSVKLFSDMIELNHEKNSRIILEKQIDGMEEHVKEVEHIYAQVHSMKHDMKNTLAIAMQLASAPGRPSENQFTQSAATDKKQQTQYSKEEKLQATAPPTKTSQPSKDLQAYLSELNKLIDSTDLTYNTGNTVVDTLLNMKSHELAKTLPTLQLNADALLFPTDLQIQSYDIGVILGNALDNAIEACQRLKNVEPQAPLFIRLSTLQKANLFLIEIANSFDGTLIQKKHREFPVTTKQNPKSHGIGLTNIQNTAEKYDGSTDWFAEQNIFTLTVMMKNEEKNR